MKIKSLLEKYSFHDSTIERINYNSIKNVLTITIDFCYWMQIDFVNGNKENGLVDLVFSDVYEYDNLLGDIDSFTILDILETSKGIKLNIEDAYNQKYYSISIQCSDVDFIVKDLAS